MSESDALRTYRAKRDFRITTEPSAAQRRRKPDTQGTRSRGAKSRTLRFVVQKHAARNLHYDFRLEIDGVLKSWAVPKGPSLDPAVRRMAVHVEDHPMDYADFEGTIPPKQYGAGTVIVWDRGTWLPEDDPETAYREGKLKFALRGRKLTGRWMLVRMRGRDERQEPWLLIKERDDAARPESEYSIVDEAPGSVLGDATAQEAPAQDAAQEAAQEAAARQPPPEARRAPLPPRLAPQLATLADRVPEARGWSWEMKFDGYRILARIDGHDVRLFTRNGHDWTARIGTLAREVAALDLPSGWLDGEIVAQDAGGAPDFQRLQNAFDSQRTDELRYYVFDMPYCCGYDLRKVPLQRRRALLREWLGAHPSEHVRFSESFDAGPQELLESARRIGMEGLIGKRVDSTYVEGRSTSWIKLKYRNRQEFVVGGYTDPQGSRNAFGALLLGVHDDAGTLRYAGRVGSGFDERTLRDTARRFETLHADVSPFADPIREGGMHWLRPELVAEVSFTQWTADGRIRHPVFHGLRSDKPAAAITREKAVRPMGATRSSPARTSIAGVRISNPDRVIDESTGITKLELVAHYERVAEAMLPHLKQRPVALVRAPDGIGGTTFFQKHAGGTPIAGVRSLDTKYDPGEAPMLAVATAKGLVGLAQWNTVELHTWNATTRSIGKPDRIVFDLDPGEGVGWPTMLEGAQLVHALLDELGLTCFLKTSGGRGLHVVVPITPRHGWDTVKAFAKAVVVHLAKTLPDRFVAKSGPSNRKGRIFVDYLRNGRGATTVAAWSARARPGIGVSVPVGWDELPMLEGGNHWKLRDVEPRLEMPDPWADYRSTRQTLASAMRALDFTPPATSPR